MDGRGAEALSGEDGARRGASDEESDGDAVIFDGAELRFMERGDEEIGERPVIIFDEFADEGFDWGGGMTAFEFDIDQGAAIDRVKNLAEGGDDFAEASIELAELVEGFAGDKAVSVGGAAEGGVVDDDEVTGGEADIDFDSLGTERQGGADASEGIFGFVTGGAAVTEAAEWGGVDGGIHGEGRR